MSIRLTIEKRRSNILRSRKLWILRSEVGQRYAERDRAAARERMRRRREAERLKRLEGVA